MHLALFGGSFDPPHYGHLALAETARKELAVDSLLISVSRNPCKTASVAEDRFRLDMTRLLAGEINRTGGACRVDDWELNRPEPSYTVDYLRHIHATMVFSRLTLLLGEDNAQGLAEWKEVAEIARLSEIVVCRRQMNPSGSAEQMMQLPIPVTAVLELDVPVSSTGVRERIATGMALSGLVPPSIEAYIRHHRLYA